jgi:alpha-L-rhamnosidase
VETFRQNTLDIFMDCPSRERAGWLCDSYFTARVAHDLTGTTVVEQAFYENFLLPERFEHLPDGMLPMCYPADHDDGVFIPNWSLWFVVQLEEYLERSGDRSTADALQPKVARLFDYFAGFENSDGLLEKLESWVFVEWSAANQFVQDVNYPSNMLYAAALDAAGRMYGRAELSRQAAAIREVIRRQSYDGQFFVDHARRAGDRLEITQNRSEVCQYFAFYFDVATPETHPELWGVLRDRFGPDRKQTKAFWDVHVANSFIGNMLRLELLSKYGCQQQILDESTAYLLYMAQRTGTLWENDGAYASCNHGFASHIVHTLYRDVLGIASLDTVKRTIQVRLADVKLEWCEGSRPTPDGQVQLRWQRHGDAIHYRLQAPQGYTIQVDNLSGRELVAVPWGE